MERCTFPSAGAPLNCAVSGGADSLALLVLGVAAGCEVTAWHVDHGLRPASSGEADVVGAAAERFGAQFRAVTARVEPGPNLEARARAARRAVLPEDVATGHTADDQAETVLLNLLRGSALDGLAGMRAGPAHPVLALRRWETHKLCAELGLVPVVDPTNDDQRHRRNSLRHTLMPLLDEIAERDVARLISRQAHLLAADADLLEALAAQLDPTDANALAAAPLPLARRAVRRWLRPALSGRPPGEAAVARVLAVARGESSATDVAEGVRVQRRQGCLKIETATTFPGGPIDPPSCVTPPVPSATPCAGATPGRRGITE